MPEIDPVTVQLRAEFAKYRADMEQTARRVEASLNLQERSIIRLEGQMDKGFTRIGAHAARGAAAIRGAIGSIGLIALGAQAVETALRFQRFEKGLEIATGSASQAADEIKFLRDMADTLGVRFITLAENFTGLAAAARGTALEGKATRDVFEAVTKAIVATGGSTEQVNGALLAVQQIMSKGTVSAEELRGQLGERLPGAFQIAARAMGVTTAELGKLLEKGDVASTDFLPKFADQLGKELPANLQTADAAFQRFQTALDDVANSTADGFMKELGDATDDLTQTLKEMQQSGALEAIGSFLGEVIRLGGGAASAIGDLALAWKKWRLEVGVRQQQNIESGWLTSAADKDQARRNRSALEAELIRMSGKAKPSFAQGSLDYLDAIIKRQGAGGGVAASSSGAGKKKSGGTKKSPLDPEAFAREEANLNDQILRLKSDDAQTAEQRAEVENTRVEQARLAANADVEADKRYTSAQKQKIVALNDQVAALEVAKIAYERDAEIAKRTYELESDANRNAQDLLQSQSDIATTRSQQFEIEKRILKLRQSQERAEYELLLKSRDAPDRDRGRAGLAQIDKKFANQNEALDRKYESPLAAYSRRLNEADVPDLVEQYAVQQLDYVHDTLRDAITKKLGIKDPFLAGIIDLFIQQAIIKPLANAMSQAGGGGGGIGGLLTSVGTAIFGRASGGPVAPGQLVRVNEAGSSGRVEGFRPSGGGDIIPLGRMNAASRGTTTTIQPIIQVDARGAVMNDQFAKMILSQANQAAAGMVGAGAKAINANIPNRLSQYSRDGT
jgi:tape measure domain-containing protein